jgi:hypothetical protein
MHVLLFILFGCAGVVSGKATPFLQSPQGFDLGHHQVTCGEG